jgi:hypothetical protein
MDRTDIEYISRNISNPSYNGNFEATKQLIDLFNKIARRPLRDPDDYINMYDDSFYTYWTWEALVESEAEQNEGMTEEECKEALNHCIWQLPCGWYVQYV